MDYITTKQLNYLLSIEPKINTSDISKERKVFLQDIVDRVKKFGLKTVLSKHEAEKIARIVNWLSV